MKEILVTAFEPFGGEALNPTEMVLGMLPDEIGGYAIRKLVLPVEYGRSAEIAEAEYDRLRPSAVIMLGQAGGRSAITPETTAKNLMNSDQADNAGFLADHLRIDESRPDTLSSTLPIDRIADALTARGIPCERSEDAGTYVCNALFYRMLAHCSSTASVEIRTKTEVPSKTTTEVPTGFIHVPFVKEQGHTDKPFMELSDIRTAVEIIVETIIETVATAAALETAII